MAETSNPSSTAPPDSTVSKRRPQKIPLHKIYALPAPIKTFPLPSFYPSNPLSLAHVIYAWLSQTVFSRPPDEPSTIHRGMWSPETRSVHIADPATMRALWEQGFFGKGSLSRSEPNWLKREMNRRGLDNGNVAEQVTRQRREERLRLKWERARLEQEAIERTRLEEAIERTRLEEARVVSGASDSHVEDIPSSTLQELQSTPSRSSLPHGTVIVPPVGPLQLLQLPNSEAELKLVLCANGLPHDLESRPHETVILPPVGPLQLLRLPNSEAELKLFLCANGLSRGSEPRLDVAASQCEMGNGSVESPSESADGMAVELVHANGGLNHNKHVVNGLHQTNGNVSPIVAVVEDAPKSLKRQKSVRFSPEVESTTFEHNDPPSPVHSSISPPSAAADEPSANLMPEAAIVMSRDEAPAEIENREHLQLSAEEAFYLAFGIGALAIVDPKTQSELSTEQLLHLFADHSFFPPRISSVGSPGMRTDDPFLVQYVVYHHFRSLGWVPREGVKFGVDWLIYRRGPVFDHAEFGLLVIPSYSDPSWEGQERRSPQRQPSWHWLHGVQRVLSHVLKSLVLVYVDIPPPSAVEALSDPQGGIPGLLGHYRVREVMVRRWSSNRNR